MLSVGGDAFSVDGMPYLIVKTNVPYANATVPLSSRVSAGYTHRQDVSHIDVEPIVFASSTS